MNKSISQCLHFVCVNILPVCEDGQLMCAQCSRMLDKAPDLELELRTVVGHRVGAGSRTRVLCMASSVSKS